MLVNKDGLTEEEFLKQYNPGDYKRPSVTADILILGMNKIFSNLKILLIKRGDHPFMNCWALPGGFIEDNETAFAAAQRELEEETGLKDVYLDQVYTFTKPGRDPRTWVMSIAYMALVSKLEKVEGLDDAADAAWFDFFFTDDKIMLINEEKKVVIEYKLEKQEFSNGILTYKNFIPTSVSKEKLAFDHVEILIESMMKLRQNFTNSDQIYCLLPKTFTMAEVKATYEAVMNVTAYKQTISRFVKDKITATGNKKKSAVIDGNKSTEYTYKKGI